MGDRNEFAGFLQPGWRVGGDVVRVGVSDLERAVLNAADEERRAELTLVSEMERLQCYGAETARRLNDATAARRAAVDDLRRARDGEGE